MTDMTPTPEPPPNYRLLTDEEKQRPLPMGAMHLANTDLGLWAPSECCGNILTPFMRQQPYAVPLSPVAEPQEHNPDNLTPERVGEGRRLLSAGELIELGDEWFTGKMWKPVSASIGDLVEPDGRLCFRRRISPVAGKEQPVNGCSSLHPHEPEIVPVYDEEGRCLVCLGLSSPPANAAEVGPSGQPDGGAESANPGNNQQASKQTFTHKSVLTVQAATHLGVIEVSRTECSDPENPAGFVIRTYDLDATEPRHRIALSPEGMIALLAILSELLNDADPATPSTTDQCAAKLSEGQPANAETEQGLRLEAIAIDIQKCTSLQIAERIVELEAQLSTLRAENKGLRTDIVGYKAELSRVREEQIRDHESFERLIEQRNSLENQLAESERKREEAEKTLHEIRAAVESDKKQLATLQDGTVLSRQGLVMLVKMMMEDEKELIAERDALKAQVEGLAKFSDSMLQQFDLLKATGQTKSTGTLLCVQSYMMEEVRALHSPTKPTK
jgi:predicted  nucleic acid-binding Zn-ribbon protein